MRKRASRSWWPVVCAVLTTVAVGVGNFAPKRYDNGASAVLVLPLLIATASVVRAWRGAK